MKHLEGMQYDIFLSFLFPTSCDSESITDVYNSPSYLVVDATHLKTKGAYTNHQGAIF